MPGPFINPFYPHRTTDIVYNSNTYKRGAIQGTSGYVGKIRNDTNKIDLIHTTSSVGVSTNFTLDVYNPTQELYFISKDKFITLNKTSKTIKIQSRLGGNYNLTLKDTVINLNAISYNNNIYIFAAYVSEDNKNIITVLNTYNDTFSYIAYPETIPEECMLGIYWDKLYIYPKSNGSYEKIMTLNLITNMVSKNGSIDPDFLLNISDADPIKVLAHTDRIYAFKPDGVYIFDTITKGFSINEMNVFDGDFDIIDNVTRLVLTNDTQTRTVMQRCGFSKNIVGLDSIPSIDEFEYIDTVLVNGTAYLLNRHLQDSGYSNNSVYIMNEFEQFKINRYFMIWPTLIRKVDMDVLDILINITGEYIYTGIVVPFDKVYSLYELSQIIFKAPNGTIQVNSIDVVVPSGVYDDWIKDLVIVGGELV